MSRSHRERLAPQNADEMEAFAKAITDQRVRGALELLGVDPATLDRAEDTTRQWDAHLSEVELIAVRLAPLGWIPFSSMPHDVYRAAAEAATEGRLEDAESILVEGWNREGRLHSGLRRVKSLGVGEERYHTIFRRRWELLDRALKHHEAGAFEASVLIVLAQMDGIAVDVTGDRDQSFFKGFDHLEDDKTLAGHPEGLKAIARLMSRDVKTTTTSGELRRHGIVHGRELGYDTRENSTRAFAALFNLVEWAQPRMQERARRWGQAERDRWAGSDELDEDGRRRDRRGFDDAKVLVTRLVTVQTAHFEKRGCYARTIDELLGNSAWSDVVEVTSDDVDLATSADASEFWLHVVTPTGFVFGSAGRGGDPGGWFYAGERAPVGGISDDDWRHAARDPAHIEW